MPKGWRLCKNCGTSFEKKRPLQSCCDPICAWEWVKKLKEKQDKKEWNSRKKELIEKTKTLTDYKKDLQTLVNKYVRLTKESECISCKKDLNGLKFDAGHYRTVGSNPALRFETLNIWPQCVKCNRDLHGNLLEYRINLVKKLGNDTVQWLESEHPPKKYTVQELQDLTKHYKTEIKKLEQKK